MMIFRLTVQCKGVTSRYAWCCREIAGNWTVWYRQREVRSEYRETTAWKRTVTRIRSNGVTRIVAAAFALALCGSFSGRAAEPEDGGLDIVKVRKNFYMIAGA